MLAALKGAGEARGFCVLDVIVNREDSVMCVVITHAQKLATSRHENVRMNNVSHPFAEKTFGT